MLFTDVTKCSGISNHWQPVETRNTSNHFGRNVHSVAACGRLFVEHLNTSDGLWTLHEQRIIKFVLFHQYWRQQSMKIWHLLGSNKHIISNDLTKDSMFHSIMACETATAYRNKELEQLERLRSEYTPAASWLPILLSHIGSQVKRTQSYKFKEFVKISKRHTWRCLIRCANMKRIRRVLLKIQSGHHSIHRRTDEQGETSIPLSTSLKRGHKQGYTGGIPGVQKCSTSHCHENKILLFNTDC